MFQIFFKLSALIFQKKLCQLNKMYFFFIFFFISICCYTMIISVATIYFFFLFCCPLYLSFHPFFMYTLPSPTVHFFMCLSYGNPTQLMNTVEISWTQNWLPQELIFNWALLNPHWHPTFCVQEKSGCHADFLSLFTRGQLKNFTSGGACYFTSTVNSPPVKDDSRED